MPLDITQIPAKARAALLRDGERFSSGDTLEQANRTLNAYNLHGPKLTAFGFAPEDATELTEARDALIAAGADRDTKRNNKRINTLALASAIQQGLQVRVRAHSIAAGARRALLRADNIAATQKIDATLQAQAQAPDQAEELAQHLDALRVLFADPDFSNASASRGGPQTAADLKAAAEALRHVMENKAEPKGTPAETETLDIIDGIIVSLARAAQKAAKAAARELGEPAIAEAFELTALYNRSPKAKAPGQTPPATP